MRVAEYNFYRMNASGVIDSANAMKFIDDSEALRHARAMNHPAHVEIWSGKRKVSIVPPSVDRRGAADRRSH